MMRYYDLDKYRVAALTLGTVGLGMNYGIANKSGQPQKGDALRIIGYAFENGVTTFDTAHTYGDAEELMGDFMQTSDQNRHSLVITKFKITRDDLSDYAKAREAAFASVKRSLKNLRLDKLPLCLLHMSRDLDPERTALYVSKIFAEMKEGDMVDIAGVSIDHPREAEIFINHDVFQVFQVPVNVFDQRLITSGMLRNLHRSGKTVFARSVFLQGLFFLPPGELCASLRVADPCLRSLYSIAEKEGVTVQQLAFSYVRDMQEIASIVFGAEKIEQVSQNIGLLQSPPVSMQTRAYIEKTFENTPEYIITPGMWV